jgi:alkylhydroperoxidase family enzyme
MNPYEAAIADLRRAAQPGRTPPAAMQPYLDQVHNGAYRISDRDVESLRAAGFTEDEIFEQTVSAAVAEGLARLDAALGVLR